MSGPGAEVHPLILFCRELPGAEECTEARDVVVRFLRDEPVVGDTVVVAGLAREVGADRAVVSEAGTHVRVALYRGRRPAAIVAFPAPYEVRVVLGEAQSPPGGP